MIMKKIVLLPLFVALLLASCESVLDLTPRDTLNYDNYYQSKEDAVAAVNAIYDVLGNVDLYNSSLWLIQDIASDDCDLRTNIDDPNLRQFDQYSLQSTNNNLQGVWKDSYNGILRANLAIERIPDIDMDKNQQDALLGEAKFLRALFYYNLVRMFGDVPLITKTSLVIDDYKVARSPKNLVYDTIVSDLSWASLHLPPVQVEKGRATKGAALAILANVYLTNNQWELAAARAKDVIDLNRYDLFTNFTDVFKVANYNGKESVFEVQFYDGDPNERSRIVISGLPSIFAFPAGVGLMLPTQDLLNTFETDDPRYKATFFSSYFYFGNNTFYPHIWKYWDQGVYPPAQTTKASAHFYVMRYAEVFLIYAEALNEIGSSPSTDAYYYLNRIRQRARGASTTVLPDLSGLSKEEFRLAVWKERRCEFVNEGHRWFDLVRTGKLEANVSKAKPGKAAPTSTNYVFPIPQRELDLNKNLKQNPEY
jgi:starch-binding outer membrane protein, SusD/RagB family